MAIETMRMKPEVDRRQRRTSHGNTAPGASRLPASRFPFGLLSDEFEDLLEVHPRLHPFGPHEPPARSRDRVARDKEPAEMPAAPMSSSRSKSVAGACSSCTWWRAGAIIAVPPARPAATPLRHHPPAGAAVAAPLRAPLLPSRRNDVAQRMDGGRAARAAAPAGSRKAGRRSASPARRRAPDASARRRSAAPVRSAPGR